jgi:catabolite regulation protein CreA
MDYVSGVTCHLTLFREKLINAKAKDPAMNTATCKNMLILRGKITK